MADTLLRKSSNCRRTRHTGAGFTLVELLVVVSVIALLIAILLPSLKKARAQAKSVKCRTNLRQISLAWQDYVVDHDGRFLQGFNSNINFGGRQGNGGAYYGGTDPQEWPKPSVCHSPVPKPLNPYLGLPETTWNGAEEFHCPADRGSARRGPTFFSFYGNSYVTNPMLIDQEQIYVPSSPDYECRAPLLEAVNERLAGISISKVTSNPAKLLLLGDSGWAMEYLYNIRERIEWHDKPFWHNVAFLDGHAEFVKVAKGRYVTESYTIVPFQDLLAEAASCPP